MKRQICKLKGRILNPPHKQKLIHTNVSETGGGIFNLITNSPCWNSSTYRHGKLYSTVILAPGGLVTGGSIGFKVKGTTGTFQHIEVN